MTHMCITCDALQGRLMGVAREGKRNEADGVGDMQEAHAVETQQLQMHVQTPE